jgi:hypothetical protein
MAIRPALAASVALLAVASIGFGAAPAQAARPTSEIASPAAAPAAPTEVELRAGSDSSITITWAASAGATSYRIYRGTASGGEAATPIAATAGISYTDAHLSSTPIYFYQVAAVSAGAESARSAESASKTPPPIGTGGNVAGTPSGNGKVYYCKDALLGGFDWFQTLQGWFPQVLGSSGSVSPGNRVVDMAYSTVGTMTFNNVVVPASGLYTIDFRYAFASGLFPGVTNRRMGLRVNGTTITSTQRYLITGSFDTYQHSVLQVRLNAGVNSISQLAVTDHGVARVDQLTVTPATASGPSEPTALTAAPGSSTVMLSWTRSASGSPASYGIYRGTKSDGEATTPIGTTAGTAATFTDTTVRSGTQYFYYVVANNTVGTSPSTNEVTIVA